ncbi:hypothetical protein [Klebsiella pneumoniae]|uniref:hypothetical protein n=1 Tax=Klebsiella pneumoniae TaxID=573 RepID=UPI001FCB3331|nr:hypothetical protein [Klebsiella pneumoniae]
MEFHYKKVKNSIDINSIQFLLAIQTWKEIVEGFNLKPKIYYSHHEKPKPPKKNQKAKKNTGGESIGSKTYFSDTQRRSILSAIFCFDHL